MRRYSHMLDNLRYQRRIKNITNSTHHSPKTIRIYSFCIGVKLTNQRGSSHSQPSIIITPSTLLYYLNNFMPQKFLSKKTILQLNRTRGKIMMIPFIFSKKGKWFILNTPDSVGWSPWALVPSWALFSTIEDRPKKLEKMISFLKERVKYMERKS